MRFGLETRLPCQTNFPLVPLYLQLISISGRDLLKTYDARSVLILPFFFFCLFSSLDDSLPKSTISPFLQNIRSTLRGQYVVQWSSCTESTSTGGFIFMFYQGLVELHSILRSSTTVHMPPRYHLHAWPISQGLELPAQNSGTSVCWSARNHRLKMMH